MARGQGKENSNTPYSKGFSYKLILFKISLQDDTYRNTDRSIDRSADRRKEWHILVTE